MIIALLERESRRNGVFTLICKLIMAMTSTLTNKALPSDQLSNLLIRIFIVVVVRKQYIIFVVRSILVVCTVDNLDDSVHKNMGGGDVPPNPLVELGH